MGFQLIFKTTSGVLFQKDVDEAYFPGANGPIGIFPGYDEGIIGMDKSGVISVKIGAETLYFAVFGGVLEVKDDVVTLLSDDIESAESIDMSRAMLARDRALDKLNNSKEAEDVIAASSALKRALARINAKNGSLGGDLK